MNTPQSFCIGCAKAVDAWELLSIEVSNDAQCPDCQGWDFRPLHTFDTLPAFGSAYYDKGLVVNVAADRSLSALLAKLSKSVLGDHTVESHFIRGFDFCLLTAWPRWPLDASPLPTAVK